jgi:hypothetical protein
MEKIGTRMAYNGAQIPGGPMLQYIFFNSFPRREGQAQSWATNANRFILIVEIVSKVAMLDFVKMKQWIDPSDSNANKHDCECEEGRAVLAALYLTVQRGTHK